MGLGVMILGLALFFGAHVVTTQRALRARLIAVQGNNAYRIVYSLISALGLVLIVWGFAHYRTTGWIELWRPPRAMTHVALALMLFSAILLVASYVRGRIYTAVKHPMLAGVMLWALAHLLVNGDLGSIVLFASFLVWAAFDRITLMHRSDPGAPPIPVNGIRADVIAVFAGVVLYLGLAFVFHPYVIGVPVTGV